MSFPKSTHDDVIQWKHFPRYWPFVRGIHRSPPGEFPAQRPVMQSFDVFFDLRLNKRLSKLSWGWWYETPLCPLWRHCNEIAVCPVFLPILRQQRHTYDHLLERWSFHRGFIVYKDTDRLERWSFYRGSIVIIFSCFLQNQDERSTACSGHEPSSPRTPGPSGPAGHDLAASNRGHPSAFVAGTWDGKFPARLCRWYGSHPTGYRHILFHLSNRCLYRTNRIHPLLGTGHMGWNIREY